MLFFIFIFNCINKRIKKMIYEKLNTQNVDNVISNNTKFKEKIFCDALYSWSFVFRHYIF